MRRESKLIDRCPIQGVIDVISKKWALLIVAVLGNTSKMRYNDIMNKLQGISPKTLADTLKGLQRAGIVSREAFNEIPPRVDYALTEDGKTLRNVTLPLIQWAVDRSSHKECVVLQSVIGKKPSAVKR